MFDRESFERSKREQAFAQSNDKNLRRISLDFVVESDKYAYGYQWTWLGVPVIQLPQDILITQEIIWNTKPDLIVETGIAWGGSIVLYAAILELIGNGRVIGIDVALPDKNRREIMKYPFSRRITLYEGSSVEPDIVSKVVAEFSRGEKVMVLLDSDHTHDHVLQELRMYAPLVTPGQYLVVSDTVVDDIPIQEHRPRPWSRGNNPKTALNAYLKETDRFEIDDEIDAKLLVSYSPNGYVRCTR
ncbi:MAG: cephalosporin hydroxylase family protein [Rhodothermia bacterium]|nr:MAG: cephalosporin hydroxylase family protein [Rhodothermia bacterium]